MILVFTAMNVFAIAVGIGFTLVGAWVVLPFAGLEMAVVGVVGYRLFRHADDHDVVVISNERVTVIRRRGGRERQENYQQYWAKVVLEQRTGWYPSQLKVGSHGSYVVIAADVSEEERQTLAKSLSQALQRNN